MTVIPKRPCGRRLIWQLRFLPDAAEREAAARRDFWRLYKVQLAHIACERAEEHEGKCVWRYAVSWWSKPGVAPETPDPETDQMIGEYLRSRTSRLTKVAGILGAIGMPLPSRRK